MNGQSGEPMPIKIYIHNDDTPTALIVHCPKCKHTQTEKFDVERTICLKCGEPIIVQPPDKHK